MESGVGVGRDNEVAKSHSYESILEYVRMTAVARLDTREGRELLAGRVGWFGQSYNNFSMEHLPR